MHPFGDTFQKFHTSVYCSYKTQRMRYRVTWPPNRVISKGKTMRADKYEQKWFGNLMGRDCMSIILRILWLIYFTLFNRNTCWLCFFFLFCKKKSLRVGDISSFFLSLSPSPCLIGCRPSLWFTDKTKVILFVFCGNAVQTSKSARAAALLYFSWEETVTFF